MQPDVLFEPTPHDLVEQMLDLAGLQPGEVLYDLGCGDGRILAAALRRGAMVAGWDCDQARIDEARANLPKNGSWHVGKADLFDVDLSGADVVTAYLLPKLNDRLLPQLAKLKPGARFVSNLFGLTGIPADQQIATQEPGRSIYLWRAPIATPAVSPPVTLTVGMASFRDYYGVWPTIQSLRMHHAEVMDRTEIILVDNEPDGPHGQYNRDLMGWLQNAGQRCRYIPFGDVRGTAAPRELVFREAAGEIVLCMDSHVMLWPCSLARLIAWFAARPGSKDLVGGPMLYDGLNTWNTHFDDRWQSDMWGTWGAAWACECGSQFSVCQRPPATIAPAGTQSLGECCFQTLTPPQRTIADCPKCGRPFPDLHWAGHEAALERAGYRRLAAYVAEPEFEIPAAGLGVFACRKDAWPGFNPKFRGFGGEEHYIHEKVRRAGGRCLCLPFLRWLHRYGNPSGPGDPRTKWHLFRNYVIGHAELGLPVERVRANMTTPIPDDEWAQLVADPHNPPEWPVMQAATPQQQAAGQCCTEQGPVGETSFAWFDNHPAYKPAIEILNRAPPSDTLIVDHGTGPEVGIKLMNQGGRARRFVAVYGTRDAAIMGALSNWNNHNREWAAVTSFAGDDTDPAGLAILSRLPADWPDEPIVIYRLGAGPGAELKKLLAKLGIEPTSTCTCNYRADVMDLWGVDGCRRNREKIAGWLREGAGEWGWTDKLAAAARAAITGLAFRISWTDPYPSLIDEACRRASITEGCAA